MFKKVMFGIITFIFIMPCIVSASVGSLVMVGGKYYETLEDAISNARSTDTIKLISDIKLDDTMDINKTVNINLNGKDITGPEKVF